jgi:hypothetical protein
MTTTDNETVQNADGVKDAVDGAPQDTPADTAAAEKAEAKAAAAAKAAETRRKNKQKADREAAAADVTPSELRDEGRVSTKQAEHAKDSVVHLFEFDNGYSAKVWQRERGGVWEWAPMRDGRIIRNLPDVGRVPAQTTVARINEGLAIVAALEA